MDIVIYMFHQKILYLHHIFSINLKFKKHFSFNTFSYLNHKKVYRYYISPTKIWDQIL